jgi:hypothetical protein
MQGALQLVLNENLENNNIGHEGWTAKNNIQLDVKDYKILSDNLS